MESIFVGSVSARGHPSRRSARPFEARAQARERLRVTVQPAEMRAAEPPGFDQAARHEITLLTDDSDSRVHPPRCRSCRAIRPFCRKS
jgi:hypothetical protein